MKSIPPVLRAAKSPDVADILYKNLGLRNVVMVGMIRSAPADTTLVGRATTMRIAPSRTERETARFAEFVGGAGRDDVLVIDSGGDTSFASWGGNNAARAQAKGVAGLVVDGAVRDLEEIEKLGFPVFCKGYSPRSWRGAAETLSMNEPVFCAGAVVRPGDYLVADKSGVVVVPAPSLKDVTDRLTERIEKDRVSV